VSVKPGNVKFKTYADSLSYALGFVYGLDFSDVPFKFNNKMILKGLVNAQNNRHEYMTEEQMLDLMDRFQENVSETVQKEQNQIRIRNQVAGKAFMTENAQDPEVKTTASGLQYKAIKRGTGRQVKANSTVTAHYSGKFLDGEVFDSSYNRGEPLTFEVDMVIEGWSEGLQLMREGDVFEFVIPDSLAYGAKGYDIIGPGAYLIFEVELIGVKESL
jgi:FKBP-type peptidyl-prolyl cis-trans isomerase FklB